ncbi:hypothetical protein PJ15_1070 [Acinetobacter sp. neg1]|nr:hypothetical protein PJ15_1070 [Acinetobacter sp. neg1]
MYLFIFLKKIDVLYFNQLIKTNSCIRYLFKRYLFYKYIDFIYL